MNYPTLFPLLLSLILLSSCQGQTPPQESKEFEDLPETDFLTQIEDLVSDKEAQIGEFVVEIFEDEAGSLWFGTMSRGVAKFDASPNESVGQGNAIKYISMEDGLNSNAVASITQDKDGNMWFGTQFGLSKYDASPNGPGGRGEAITNYTTKEGLCHNSVSEVLIDSKGNFWVGTWGGVCLFDGTTFTNFPLPIPDIEVPPYQGTKDWVTEIMEDRAGNIWFTRSGYGAYKYDGKNFTPFTTNEGLPSNCVQAIHEDQQGNIWFGTRVAEKDHPEEEQRVGEGGLSRYDGKNFQHFPELEGLSKNDIYSIGEDKSGNVWVGATRLGAYRFDRESYLLYKETDRMDLTQRMGIQSILEDQKGNLWFGFSGGLFRFDGDEIINVTKGGPWE